MQKLEKFLEWGGIKKDIIFLSLSAVALLASLFHITLFGIDLAWISILLCGIPILLDAAIGLITAFDIKADVLVSLALIASIIIGEIFAAGEVAFIMQLGALLEDLTVSKARAGIEKLVRLTPHTARIISAGPERVVPAEQVQVGDILRVLPGESIPVDGIILSGQTSINQAVMTGESLPVDKAEGDSVSSGTVNQFGSFDMQATRVGEDSSIQRMIRLVQSADAAKAKIVGIADRWATWIVVIALAAAALTWAISGQIIRAVTILVVFCPCALVLATPTAIMAAIGNATRHGFLVREGDALERLALVRKIAFDKTGTLTLGIPRVLAAVSCSAHWTEQALYHIAASAELRSEHPLGRAIVRCYRAQYPKEEIQPPNAFQMIPGQGVSANVKNREILAGNAELLLANGIALTEECQKRAEDYIQKGCTLTYIAANGQFLGFLALSDTVRQDARSTIKKIKQAGVCPILLTGDQRSAANEIAKEAGIEEVYANCLPEDKLHRIESLQRTGEQVCMIGDGINDAPALKAACVGIAMGGIGSDIAVEAADIALINDQIGKLPHLLNLSRRMMITIKCNLVFSMALNFAAIILAITGVLNPVIGALVHNAGSVLVIINSAFLLHWGRKQRSPLHS